MLDWILAMSGENGMKHGIRATWAAWVALCALAFTGALGLTGCASSADPTCMGSGCSNGGRDSGRGRDSGPLPTGIDAGNVFGVDAGTRTTTTTSTRDAGSMPVDAFVAPVGATGMPCDVQAIVYAKCSACHSNPPRGTYMPLITRDDFLRPSTTAPTRSYADVSADRINDSANPMPPTSHPALTASELATLNAWLTGGTPMSSEVCTSRPDPGQPVEYADPGNLECHRFLAHQPGDKNTPFAVGVKTDAYFNMAFQAPWPGTAYGVIFNPIIDNGAVLHHWLLYTDPLGGADGSVVQSSGQHTTGELLAGWAPGGTAIDFRIHGDVGVEMPSQTYLMEFHYNSSNPAATDRSGVEICIVREPPAHVAAQSWLGLDHGIESYASGAIFGTYASGNCSIPSTRWEGTCRPQGPGKDEPIHLLYMFPHMHQAGVHMTSIIHSPDGSTRTLHDRDFDFNYQVTYPTNEVLMPGEYITTTCFYDQPKCAGQATSAEMCYLFTYAYPAGAMVDYGLWGTFAHGEGACLGQ